jgi:hypothetical protein
MTRLIDVDIMTDEPDAPYYDQFDISAYQIASAISRNGEITIDEAELLKQWLTNFIQDTLEKQRSNL